MTAKLVVKKTFFMFFYFDQKWEVLDSIFNTIRVLKVDDTHVTNFDAFV